MYFENDKIKLFYEKYGDKPRSIIILPGWGDNRHTFDALIDKLKSYFSVYIFDYPGFGNSPIPKTNLTIYDYSLLIKEFINEKNIYNPILLGHSFGGRIIITLLGYYKIKCEKIILMNSAGIRLNKKISFKTKCYKLLKLLGNILPKKLKSIYLEWLFNKFASSDYKTLPKAMRKTFQNVVNEDLFYYLKEIDADTLLIWGDKDTSTPLDMGKIMEKEIPNNGLVTIHKTGHFSYLENPNLVTSIILEYLKSEIN